MPHQILQNQIPVAGIALGAGGVQALAIMRQRVGMKGEQIEMRILQQDGDQSAARWFQGHGQGPAAEALGQLGGPGLDRFGSVLQLAATAIALGGEHAPGVLAVGPIDTARSGVARLGSGCVDNRHGFLSERSSQRRQDLVRAKTL